MLHVSETRFSHGKVAIMATTTMKQPPKQLSPLVGHVFGFVDSDEKLEKVLNALEPLGFSKSEIVVFRGEQGLRLLDRLRSEVSSDDEKDLVETCSEELRAGHIGIEMEVENQDEARLVSDMAAKFQVRHFTYFGPWFTWFVT